MVDYSISKFFTRFIASISCCSENAKRLLIFSIFHLQTHNSAWLQAWFTPPVSQWKCFFSFWGLFVLEIYQSRSSIRVVVVKKRQYNLCYGLVSIFAHGFLQINRIHFFLQDHNPNIFRWFGIFYCYVFIFLFVLDPFQTGMTEIAVNLAMLRFSNSHFFSSIYNFPWSKEPKCRSIVCLTEGSLFVSKVHEVFPLHRIWSLDWQEITKVFLLLSRYLDIPSFPSPEIIDSKSSNKVWKDSFLVWNISWMEQSLTVSLCFEC